MRLHPILEEQKKMPSDYALVESLLCGYLQLRIKKKYVFCLILKLTQCSTYKV
jgi:hypothetical protein